MMRKKMKIKILIMVLFITSLFLGFLLIDFDSVPVVENVDIERYDGHWKALYNMNESFEQGCECVTAEYTIIDNDTIKVENYCKRDGEEEYIEGTAETDNNDGKLSVSFFPLIKSDYNIIDIEDGDDEYEYALVGSSDRKFLWVLSRSYTISDEVLERFMNTAHDYGYNIDELSEVEHKNC